MTKEIQEFSGITPAGNSSRLGIDISDYCGGSAYMDPYYSYWQPIGRALTGSDHMADVSILTYGFPEPIKVYFNGKYTIVEWSDGVKTKAGLHAEEFDEEKGIAMAIARRFLGRGQFERLLENADDQRGKQ